MIQVTSPKDRAATKFDDLTSMPNFDPAELLAREADHRIKNSLQLIAAMLHLQAQRNCDVPALREALTQACHRVRTVAKLHDHLHRSIGGDQDAGAYLRALCSSLSHSLGLSTPASVVVEASYVPVQPDRLLRLGLIVTELVTNAVKYGTPPSGTRDVKVALVPGADNTLSLLVADNGPGIPDNALLGPASGLGMYLVHHLTRTIGGRLEIDGTPPGARFTVNFAADSRSGHGAGPTKGGNSCA